MTGAMEINKILLQIKQLDKEEQLSLLEKIVFLLRQKKDEMVPVALSSITGIGSDIWANLDIDKYIENEREW